MMTLLIKIDSESRASSRLRLATALDISEFGSSLRFELNPKMEPGSASTRVGAGAAQWRRGSGLAAMILLLSLTTILQQVSYLKVSQAYRFIARRCHGIDWDIQEDIFAPGFLRPSFFMDLLWDCLKLSDSATLTSVDTLRSLVRNWGKKLFLLSNKAIKKARSPSKASFLEGTGFLDLCRDSSVSLSAVRMGGILKGDREMTDLK